MAGFLHQLVGCCLERRDAKATQGSQELNP
jgi:hypothetical protein